MQSETRATAVDYAPGGTLRAALNFGNPVLARRGEDGPAGITIDLAREIAGSLGAGLGFVEFDRAFDVSSSAADDAWDICFLAVDPERARAIAFTLPYVRILGCYLVATGTGAQSGADVVGQGLRIGVVQGSAYALFLSRQPGADKLVTFPTFAEARAAFDQGEIDGIGGIEQVMVEAAAERPDVQVIYPPFMEIRQAMGVPLDRAALLPDLQERLSGLRDSGRLAEILERHGVSGDCAI